MKSVRQLLRAVLESEGQIEKVAIVYQLRGKKAQAVHNFETKPQCVAFVNEALRLSDDELLKVMRGRQ